MNPESSTLDTRPRTMNPAQAIASVPNPAAFQTRLVPLDHHRFDGRRGIAPREFPHLIVYFLVTILVYGFV